MTEKYINIMAIIISIYVYLMYIHQYIYNYFLPESFFEKVFILFIHFIVWMLLASLIVMILNIMHYIGEN